MRTKLWSVTVNNWTWDKPRTLYFKSRQEAETEKNKYPAADDVKYAGYFKADNAKTLLYPYYKEVNP